MPAFGPVVPVLRIFDEAKAREFYVDFLGCAVGFEHRFGANFPLYMSVVLPGSPAGATLHLSEHHGDASPGARIRIATDDIDGLAARLAANAYRYAKPGRPEPTPWGSRELEVTDPFGNRLTFHQD